MGQFGLKSLYSVFSFVLIYLLSFSLMASDDPAVKGEFSPCASHVANLRARGIEAVLRRVEARLEQSPVKTATHFNPIEDQRRAQTWTGILGPRVIRESLPEGARLIDHQTLGAERGLVKMSAGRGTFLRATIGKTGANVLVLNKALEDNLNRPNKSFVRKNAKAVVLFMHGGGTRTTGSHVALGMQGHMYDRGVDVIGMDGAWHAEGDRVFRANPKDYFDHVLRPFIEKYLKPAGVPVILAGHSWGGELADNYMRLYPHDDLVSGIIALSTVVDSAPGRPIREKIEQAGIHEKQVMEGGSGVSEDDRKLLDQMFWLNKISLPGNLFEGVFSTQNEWKIPEDGGASYLPALFVWGQADWLYVGNEELIRHYIKGLSHVELKLYDRRWDFGYKGIVNIGHLIFDHKRPSSRAVDLIDQLPSIQAVRDELMRELDGIYSAMHHSLKTNRISSQNKVEITTLMEQIDSGKPIEFTEKNALWMKLSSEEQSVILEYNNYASRRDQIEAPYKQALNELESELAKQPIEAFDDILLFVEKIVGSPLKKQKEKAAKDGLIRQILQAYANNLAFREFIDSFTFVHRKATAKIAELNKVIKGIEAYLARIQSIRRNGGTERTEKKLLIEALERPLDVNGEPVKGDEHALDIRANQLRNLRSGDYVPEGPLGARGREWAEEAKALAELRRSQVSVEKIQRERLQKIDRELHTVNEQIDEIVSQLDSDTIRSIQAEIKSRKNHIESIYYRFEVASRQHHLQILEHEGDIDSEMLKPNEELQALFIEFEAAMAEFQETKNDVMKHAVEVGLQGGRYGNNFKILLDNRAALEGQRIEQVEWLREIESSIVLYDERIRELEAFWVETYGDGYFEVERISVAEIFESEAKDLQKYSGVIQKVWGIWTNHYWKKRESLESTDLY